MAVSIQDLCKKNFASRPILQQVRIVAMGTHLPLESISKNVRTLTPFLFEQVHWLTYCKERNKFFCWPCLLFMPQFQFSIVETNTSSDFKDILVATNRHEITEDHLTCSLKLQMFISENLRLPDSTQDKVGHNYTVKKNREMLKCIIDAVCYVVGRKQFNSDGKYSSNLISIKDCKTFLQLLKECHPRKVDVVQGAVHLLSSYPGILNHLVDAMTRSVKMSIKNETKKSTYVSIILSEHGSSSRLKSQMSTILRYTNQGKVCERFIGFTNFVGIKTKDHLMQCIRKQIEEFDIGDRFLALSLDGEISYGESLSLLIASTSINNRFWYFVPWYSHGFGYVLLQTLSVHREIAFFLKMITGIQDFFRNQRHFKSLEDLLRQKIPEYSKYPYVRWNLHSNFVVYVANYRCYFVEFFEDVIRNNRSQKDCIVAQAVAFRLFLLELGNVFLLKLFYEIFNADFDETFNFRIERNAFNYDRITLFKRKIHQISVARILGPLVAEAEIGEALKLKVKKFGVLLQNLIKHLLYEIHVRCVHFSTHLGFCDLFDALGDCPSGSVLNDLSVDGRFQRLMRQIKVAPQDSHGEIFNDWELRVEMNAIKSNPDLRVKTVHELLEHFAKYNLRDLFPQSYKLVEFILTLPYLPASRQGEEISKLRDIKKFSYFPKGTGIPSGEVSFLSIESGVLLSLRQSPPFYDDVLARFYEVNNTLPLLQI